MAQHPSDFPYRSKTTSSLWGGGALEYRGGSNFFVSSATGASTNDGRDPDHPVATISQGLALCATGKSDTVHVLAGHAETLSATVTIDEENVKIKGYGQGTEQPALTIAHTGDGFNVTVDGVTVEGLYFKSSTAAATSCINVGGASCVIRGNRFEHGTNDTECITVEDAGDKLIVEGNQFVTLANGVDAAIELESASIDSVDIRGNLFHGGSATNAWDAAAINAVGLAVTNVRVYDNHFMFSKASYSAMALETAVDTSMWGNTYGGSCRPTIDTPITVYAADGRTTVGQGTLEDPTTIVEAVSRCTAAGDTVLLLPGVYTITAALALANGANEGMRIKAANGLGTVEIANDTDDLESITIAASCDGVRIEDLIFTKGAANSTDSKCFINCDASRLHVTNCIFDFESRANADGINLATGTTGHIIEKCVFTNSDAAHSAIAYACGASKFVDNFFDGSTADMIAFEQIATPGNGNLITRNTILSDGADAAVMSWQAAPGKQAVYYNYVLGSNGDADCMGDDSDLDAYFYGNYVDGGAAGILTIVDPSVS